MRSRVHTIAGFLGIHSDCLPGLMSPMTRLTAWWRDKNFTKEFWMFLSASFLFDSGMFIFFLLYNLYLLDLGFHEDFLGWTVAAMAIGGIAGSIPGGWFARRFGLRKTLLVCLFLVPLISSLRTVSQSAAWLIASAFCGGVISSLWAVVVPPVVAQITDERNRAAGFSVVFASGIGFGFLAGLLGGYLPRWMSSLHLAMDPAGAKRAVLFLACGLAAVALWPASKLKLNSEPVPSKKLYPRNSFVTRYLLALAIWSFATGAFSPFFNAYFSHGLGMPVERIGGIFAIAQLFQVLAILLAPVVFRRFGLITGIMYTQFGCALAMGWLALGAGGWWSGAAYASYTALQWMSEPGMYTLLMSRMRQEDRAGASALNLLVISGARAIAAALVGVAFARFGYPAVMAAIGAAILVSGGLFGLLLRNEPWSARAGAEEAISQLT